MDCGKCVRSVVGCEKCVGSVVGCDLHHELGTGGHALAAAGGIPDGGIPVGGSPAGGTPGVGRQRVEPAVGTLPVVWGTPRTERRGPPGGTVPPHTPGQGTRAAPVAGTAGGGAVEGLPPHPPGAGSRLAHTCCTEAGWLQQTTDIHITHSRRPLVAPVVRLPLHEFLFILQVKSHYRQRKRK